jgi:cation transport ATPase
MAIAAVAAAPGAAGAALARLPYVAAVARATARGIVFRDAPSVEAAAGVGAVVLCVRGTVTTGRLEVVDAVSLGSRSERELIALVAGAEEVVRDHPIARAFARLAAARGVTAESVRRPTLIGGRGITAISVAGESVAVGSRQLLLAESVSVAPAEDVARAVEGQQRTAVFVAIGGRVEGVFGLEDPLRDEARPAVQAMMDAGFDLALVGGESAGTLESIGLALDIVNLRPEVVPEDRAAAVRAIAEVAVSVAVVGRPQRDGVALGAADVALSLVAAGAAGGETAVALTGDDLRDAAEGLSLARQGRTRARRTVWVGAGVSLAAAGLCAFVPGVAPVGALAGAVAAVAAYGAARGPFAAA